MTNGERMQARLEQLRLRLNRLNQLRTHSQDEYLGNINLRDQVEYNLLLLIEISSDIAASYLSWLQLSQPPERRSVFLKLAEAGELPSEDAEEFAKAISMRNQPVHEYMTVDPAIVYNVFHNELSVFERFAATTLGWIAAMDTG